MLLYTFMQEWKGIRNTWKIIWTLHACGDYSNCQQKKQCTFEFQNLWWWCILTTTIPITSTHCDMWASAHSVWHCFLASAATMRSLLMWPNPAFTDIVLVFLLNCQYDQTRLVEMAGSLPSSVWLCLYWNLQQMERPQPTIAVWSVVLWLEVCLVGPLFTAWTWSNDPHTIDQYTTMFCKCVRKYINISHFKSDFVEKLHKPWILLHQLTGGFVFLFCRIYQNDVCKMIQHKMSSASTKETAKT